MRKYTPGDQINKIRNNYSSALLFVIYSLSFLGFYCIILYMLNNGGSENTRGYTIPLRIFIIIAYILLFIINFNKLRRVNELFWFTLFSTIFLFRVYADHLMGSRYYLSTEDVVFYFFSFAIIPYVVLSTYKLKKENFRIIFYSLFFTGVCFSFFVLSYYSKFIGTVERLSNTSSEEIISPLILSYCSTLTIGVVGSYLLYNRTKLLIKVLGIITILLSLVPFFLGASRGSLFALLIPFFILLLSGKSVQYRIKAILVLIIILFVVFYIGEMLGTGLFDRIVGTSDAIDKGGDSAIRLTIWSRSLDQFMSNPILGDKLSVDGWDNYPHNLFIEVLQTTGLIGFIPFTVLVFRTLIMTKNILIKNKSLGWVAIIFFQAFIQNMFSGSIVTAAWFWTSMAFLCSVKYYLKNIKFTKYENN